MACFWAPSSAYRVTSTGRFKWRRCAASKRWPWTRAGVLRVIRSIAATFMIWALSAAVIAAKNRQAIALDYVRFAWSTRSWVGPGQVLANLLRIRRTRMKWRSQRRVLKPKTAQEA